MESRMPKRISISPRSSSLLRSSILLGAFGVLGFLLRFRILFRYTFLEPLNGAVAVQRQNLNGIEPGTELEIRGKSHFFQICAVFTEPHHRQQIGFVRWRQLQGFDGAGAAVDGNGMSFHQSL